MSRPATGAYRRLFLAVIGCLVLLGCEDRASRGLELLPEVPEDQVRLSDYEPQNPYSREPSGILARTLFEALDAPGVSVRVRDYLLPQGQTTEQIGLPGPAVFEVLAGQGSLSGPGGTRELEMGATFSIAAGQVFTLESSGDVALAMRAYVFVPR